VSPFLDEHRQPKISALDEVLGKVIFTPRTWKGSNADFKCKFANATKIFEVYGNPQL